MTREKLKTGFWCLLFLAAGVFQIQAQARKPNVLMIAVDDLNDWIGCLQGHPQVQTPHMDRLAARGTLFTNAHCQAPLCNPSRASLLTGRRPSSTGIHGLSPWFRSVESLRDIESLPQHFAGQGYRTSSAGKIYHGAYSRGRDDKEFQEFGPPASGGPFPGKKLVKTPQNHKLVDWGVFDHRDEDKGDWKVADWAVQKLRSDVKEPFFMGVGFFLPHVPCYVTQKWFDLYPADQLLLPAVRADDRLDTPRFSWYLHWYLPEPRLKFLQESNEWANLVRSYLASTSFVDSQVGRVLDALDASGKSSNTIVVLWSDHGWHLGEKLISGKNTLWERSTRVPLIFAGPGIASGARCPQPVELLDIYPTLVELCSLPEQAGLEGHSLLPQLHQANTPRPWPAITTHNQGNHAVRSLKWRYVHYADGSEELYDMQADPHEWNNLAADPVHQAVLKEHRAWLPKTDVPAVPGSAQRVLRYENGRANWEGKDIGEDEAIPEL